MSTAERAREMAPDVRELEIANLRAQYDAHHIEWNRLNKAVRDARNALEATAEYRVWEQLDKEIEVAAREGRAVGLRLSEMNRAHGLTDDYTNGSNHVKVGT